MESYSFEVRRIGDELIGSIAPVMGLDKDAMIKLHGDLTQALRINYYPTCRKPNEVLGLSPHSDTSIITILMQSDDIEGLQIRHHGMWVPVKPIPDALVVNLGDIVNLAMRNIMPFSVYPFSLLDCEPLWRNTSLEAQSYSDYLIQYVDRFGPMGSTKASNTER